MTTYHSSAADPDGLRVAGVSLGHRELSEADHWIVSLDPVPVLASTHLVREPYPHVAISLTTSQPVTSEPSLRVAADAAAADRFGRAVIFPGVAQLVGTLSVAAVLELSAIDRIEILGGGEPDPETLIETRDFVRPQWRDGELVLTVTPAAGGRLVPFETRNPTPCCAAH